MWISPATLWEIDIKHGLGRGDMPVSSQDALRYFRESGCRFLPVEPMRLITHDPKVALPRCHHRNLDGRLLKFHFTQIPCVALDPFEGLQGYAKGNRQARGGFELEWVRV